MTSLTPRQQAQRRAMTAKLQRAIATHGIEPLLEGDSIKYGGDADTQPAINTYEPTDSSFGR